MLLAHLFKRRVTFGGTLFFFLVCREFGSRKNEILKEVERTGNKIWEVVKFTASLQASESYYYNLRFLILGLEFQSVVFGSLLYFRAWISNLYFVP